MLGNYNYWLVVLSLVLAIGSSFIAMSLAAHIRKVSSRFTNYWLIGGGMSMGLGIWAMHFVGMLAFHLPIPVAYDIPLTFLSLVFAIVASILALATINKGKSSGMYLYLSTFMMGTGVAAMHYVGMEALDMFPPIQYKPSLVTLSIIIAYTASFVALKLAFMVSEETNTFISMRRLYASLVMGVGIGAMHYTGMFAAVFQAGAICRALPDGIDVGVMSMLIVLGVIIILLFTFLLLIFDIKLGEKEHRLVETLEAYNKELQERAERLAREYSEKAKLASELTSYMQAIDEHAIVSATDSAGRIIQVNEKFCEITGYSREELLGQDHHIVNSGIHPKSFFIDLWTTISSGKKWHGEICNRAKNGSLYWVDSAIVPALDMDGKIDRYISVRIDITDRKSHEEEMLNAYQKVSELYRYKSEFLSSMSHELRTPLNSILGFSKTMLKGIDGPINSEQEESLEHIHKSGQHLLLLISDILDMSKLEANMIELFYSDVNIVDLINNVVNTTRILADEKGLSIKTKIDDVALSSLSCDETRIKQVMLNLASNAVKFTEQGTITYECHELNNSKVSLPDKLEKKIGLDRNAYYIFTVSDTGIGIKEEDTKKVFAEFQQIDSTASRKYAGTGLGMAISKQMINLHGGDIWLESIPEKGSSFYFVLPKKPPE